MLKAFRNARFLSGLTLFATWLTIVGPVLACDMSPMDQAGASNTAHSEDVANSAHAGHFEAKGISPMCGSAANDEPQHGGAAEPCCDEPSEGDPGCRPSSVDAMPYLCLNGDLFADLRADRTRIVGVATWALHEAYGSPPRFPHRPVGLAHGAARVNVPVPDPAILYGCMLI